GDGTAAAVEEPAKGAGPWQRGQAAYRRYAKAAATARADAVSAAESALDQIRDKATAAKQALKRAKGALARIAGQYTTIDTRLAEIAGEQEGLTKLEAYQRGQDLQPLRELVSGLRSAASTAVATARRATLAAEQDTQASERATRAAIEARDTGVDARLRAEGAAEVARLGDLDAELDAALRAAADRDLSDPEVLTGALSTAGALIERLEAGIGE